MGFTHFGARDTLANPCASVPPLLMGPPTRPSRDRTADAVSGEELRPLAEEQAALRRVATLVARGVPPEEVFAAATAEVGQLLPVDFALMGRYESDGTAAIVAGAGKRVRIGTRWPLGGTLRWPSRRA